MAQAAAAPCPAGTVTPQPGRRPRGRPRIRTELELEQRRKAWYRQRYLRSVYLGRQSERWRRVRQQLGHGKDEQTARALLDSFTERSRSGYSVKPCPFDRLGRLHTSCDALRLLVIWAHDHGQECGSIPGLRSVDPDRALWSCASGHSYCWQLVAPGDEVAVSPPHEDKLPHPEEQGEARRPRRTPAPPAEDGRRPRTRTDGLGAGPKAEERVEEVRKVTGTQEEEGSRPETPSGPEPRTPNGGGSGVPAADERGSSDVLQLVCESDSEEQQTGAAAAEPRPAVQRQRQPIAETELLLTSDNDCEEDEEERSEVDSDDEYEFFDDPKDENYIPSSDSGSERDKRRGRNRRNSVRKPPEELMERRPPRRRQEQPHPLERPKKIRKKIPKEYVRCEFEGCGKIVSNPQYLKRHMKYQHQLQRTFACSHPSCGRIFRFKTQMEEHEKLHSDQRNYICEFCGRAFKTDKNLVVHRRIHTGEKPLQCEICGFTCRQKASLNWHMRKHDAEAGYQFPCDVCGKKFEKKDNVNAHKSKSHPETLLAAVASLSALEENGAFTVFPAFHQSEAVGAPTPPGLESWARPLDPGEA